MRTTRRAMDSGVRGGGGVAPRGPHRVGARRRGRPRRVSARDRAPRRGRLPARPHAGGLRAGDQARRRLHRAGPRGHEGRTPDRAPRAEHHHHDRRAEPSRVRRPGDDEGRRRGRRDRLLRLRLHARGDQDAARRPAAAPSGRSSSTAASRSPRSRRSSTWRSAGRRSSTARSASTPRPSTRPTTPTSGFRSRTGS